VPVNSTNDCRVIGIRQTAHRNGERTDRVHQPFSDADQAKGKKEHETGSNNCGCLPNRRAGIGLDLTCHFCSPVHKQLGLFDGKLRDKREVRLANRAVTQ